MKHSPKLTLLTTTLSLSVASALYADPSFGLNEDGATLTGAMNVTSQTLNQFQAKAHPLTPGIIIKYKNDKSLKLPTDEKTRTAQLSKTMGAKLSFKRHMSGDAEVLNVESFNKSAHTDIQALAEAINDLPEVEFAEVDAWMVAYRTPDDTQYNQQWHYHATTAGMNLPAAWDETTGSGAVTVAVLDTGYRPHADLAGNVVGQYDMISSTSVSNDGNGRDSNAQDPGDWVTTNQCGDNDAQDSSWHGTHVAGTIAALSDNGTGVAGVAWNVNLVPVRVLGTCGGSLSDIADGIRWAAGLNVSGVPSNPNPADVINMSLGSSAPSACSSTYSSAINAAVNAGSTIVVAAGNDNSSQGYPPANCANVISVAATANDGARAYYSNYGSTIDIAAPGGDGCNPTSNSQPTSLSDCEGGVWEESRMILSTYNAGATTPGADSYDWSQGTSMAAPHIAGLAALMKSVNSNLTPAQIEQMIKDSADSFPNVPDHQCTTSNCGAGLANAQAAVALASGGGGGNPGDNTLSNGVAETGLSGAAQSEQFFTLEVPAGASDLNFSLSGGSGDADLYVKFGSQPSTSSYDCRSWTGTNNENCDITNVQTGTYHVLVRGYKTYSGASLLGSFTENNGGGGNQQTLFQNGTNVNIPDNNNSGGTSTIDVTRTGDSGSITISYEIVHTWRGDLSVKVYAPSGASATLHERTNSNDSADNLSGTTTLNASGVEANGEWRLVVTDHANQDTGYIDSWSIEFE